MRQRISYIFKYNLLTALIAVGVLSAAVGVTWCRYQKTESLAMQFVVQGPNTMTVLGSDDNTEPGIWEIDEAGNRMCMNFRVANGSVDNYPSEDSRFSLRLLVSEGISENAKVTLTVTDEDGFRQVFDMEAESIDSSDKYLILHSEMGKGTRYRFVKTEGEEAVISLPGGKRSVSSCSIEVQGDTKPFLAELQLVEAAYGEAVSIWTGEAFGEESFSTYILPEWEEGNDNPSTQIMLIAKGMEALGTFTCTTDSPYITPKLAADVEENEASQQLLVPVQESANVTQKISVELVPNIEALQEITEPVLATSTLCWEIPLENNTFDYIYATLLVILNPVEITDSEITPDEIPTPDEGENGESVPGTDSEGSTEGTEDTEQPGTDTEGSTEGTEDTEQPGTDSEGSTEDTESTTESGTEQTGSTENLYNEELTVVTAEMQAGTESTTESGSSTGDSTEGAGNTTESGSGTEESTEGTEGTTNPETDPEGSTGNVTDPEASDGEAPSGITLVVKNKADTHQMAVTNIAYQLSISDLFKENELRIASGDVSWNINAPYSEYTLVTGIEEMTADGFGAIQGRVIPETIISEIKDGDYAAGANIEVRSGNALPGTYQLTITWKTENNMVLHQEKIPFFVNYRFKEAAQAEVVQEEQGE